MPGLPILAFMPIVPSALVRTGLTLRLDHTIVPAYDRVRSAEFIARIFGLKY